jgi:hypothetical protein
MKTLIMKLLGLNTLAEEIAELKKFQRDLATAQEGLSAKVDEVTEKVDNIEEFDSSQYVSEDEINDRIESYINENDIVSQSYVDDEIESKVSDKVEEAIEELDIEDKVKEVVDDMDKASFGDTEELKSIVREQVKSFMLNSVKVDFIVR